MIALGIVVLVALVLALVLVAGGHRGRLASVAHLREPRITALPPRRVLQVVATGDPGVVSKQAFGLLMRTYYRLSGVPKGGPGFQAPRARWLGSLATPREQWKGAYAMPVPESVAAIAPAEDGRLRVELTTWEYGPVAEVLHVGPYSEEAPTIQRLVRFVEASGHEIVGEHEEEYVAGPGPLGPGNPRRYLTVLRYRVRPKA